MDRMGCVDIRALPLQLLLRRHPDWATFPVVVVDRDKAQGVVLWANPQAYAYRILPGMRYAAGLAISRELRGGVVTADEVDEAIALITQQLWSFSPRIEPSPQEPGVFHLDASGMRHLYPSLDVWASCVRTALQRIEFQAVVAVGFSRFGSYAAARANTRNIIFGTPEEEQTHLRGVPIERLGIDPALRDTLRQLGIETLGAFAYLPASSLRKRFGAEAAHLHAAIQGKGWTPLSPVPPEERVESEIFLDRAEDNVERLIIATADLLESLLSTLARRQQMLAAIHCRLVLDDGSVFHEELTPAVPTRDAAQILALLKLRMGALPLSAGVVEVRLRAFGAVESPRQLVLFQSSARRDLDAVYRAFAKIRAEFGNDAVVYARIQEAHLPEAQFSWELFQKLPVPHPTVPRIQPLIRRFYSPAIALPFRERREPDGWYINGMADGPVEEVIGPHLVSGGWWSREVTRAYHYVRTRSGRWLWIYRDVRRRRWFLQGEVQ